MRELRSSWISIYADPTRSITNIRSKSLESIKTTIQEQNFPWRGTPRFYLERHAKNDNYRDTSPEEHCVAYPTPDRKSPHLRTSTLFSNCGYTSEHQHYLQIFIFGYFFKSWVRLPIGILPVAACPPRRKRTCSNSILPVAVCPLRRRPTCCRLSTPPKTYLLPLVHDPVKDVQLPFIVHPAENVHAATILPVAACPPRRRRTCSNRRRSQNGDILTSARPPVPAR